MATALKMTTVKTALTKAATLEKASVIERQLNFENEMLGNVPDESTPGLSDLKEVTFPDPAFQTTIGPSLSLAKIECHCSCQYIHNLKFTLNDGTESPLLGFQGAQPNISFQIPSDVKIAKLKIGFFYNSFQPYFWLTNIELFDEYDRLIWRYGDYSYRYNEKCFETSVPEDETVIGFKAVINP